MSTPSSISIFSDRVEEELEIDLLILMLLIELVHYYETTFLNDQSVSDQTYTENQKVYDMLHGNWRACFDMCRVMPQIFVGLCKLLRDKGLAHSSRTVSVEEQMMIFLQTIGHDDRNRVMQGISKHSKSTISRYFIKILNAICIWAKEMIRPKESSENVPQHILHCGGGKYYPFFKDCIGAIDGIHVHAHNRSGIRKTPTQNVLAVCDFNMRFTFVVAGWEGYARDAEMLAHAVGNPAHNFPYPPQDKYYVVDAGYPNRKGFLAPYRDGRYHLPDFQHAAPRGKDELFNNLHYSLRNIIERSFGVLKKRWPILDKMPKFAIRTQAKIVVAAMVIHNFIIDQEIADDIIVQFDEEDINVPHDKCKQYDVEDVKLYKKCENISC